MSSGTVKHSEIAASFIQIRVDRRRFTTETVRRRRRRRRDVGRLGGSPSGPRQIRARSVLTRRPPGQVAEIVVLVSVGGRSPRKKMPGNPAVSKPALTLWRKVDESADIVPVRSLLTKKIPPPPSFAWLSGRIEPLTSRVKVLPSSAIAPPFPPPGVPGRAGFAPRPTAVLFVSTLLS